MIKIPDFPNYTINEKGEVFNQNGVELKQELSNNGYLRVSLSNKTVKHKKFLVHRLVATIFLPNPDNLTQVNHKDGNRKNNNVNNLEWCTPLYNLNYSGVIEQAKEANKQKVECIDTGIIYDSIDSVEKELGLHHSNIVACCNGRRQTVGGFRWRYA